MVMGAVVGVCLTLLGTEGEKSGESEDDCAQKKVYNTEQLSRRADT